MILTAAQVQRFWREWSKSCQARRWTRAEGLSAAEIDARRKEFLRRCGFESLTEVDRTAGFTKVLHELLVLQGTSLNSALEAGDPALNKARVLRTQILTELVPCLELYVADAKAYLTAIMEDKNRWWKIDKPVHGMTLMDLDAQPIRKWNAKTQEVEFWPSTLEQMQYTLAARLNALRNKAGDSIHDMRTRAGVKCYCARCEFRRRHDELSAEEKQQVAETLAGQPF